jgi:carboxymethylenebutenolidase
MALHIDYYASLNSPWTHMGAARIEAMADAHGASIRIYPVDFGEIFANSGGLPLPKRAPQRQAYRLQELARWRDHLGIPIHIQPIYFPSSEALSAGCVIAVREAIGDQPAIKLAHAVLKAVWQRELNPAAPETMAMLIKECDLDADSVLKLGAEPRWAERREADTKGPSRAVYLAPRPMSSATIFSGVRIGWRSSSAGSRVADRCGFSPFCRCGIGATPHRRRARRKQRASTRS